jgi:hypothetical protein
MQQNSIIKNWHNWLSESSTGASTAATAVSFISASSSSSQVGAGLAAKIGVKPDLIYTLQLPSLAFASLIYGDGRFGGDGARARGCTIDAGVATEAGRDFLEINGQAITGAGSLIVTRTSLPGQVTVRASNNGLLTLFRFGEALWTMADSWQTSLATSRDWAARFTLGAAVAERDSRGFSFWFAKPDSLATDSNTLAMVIAMTLLEAAGQADRIAKSDKVFGAWYTSLIAGRAPQETVKAIADQTANVLANRMILTQQPAAAVTGAWQIQNPAALVQLPAAGQPGKATLKPGARAQLDPIIGAIAKAIVPTTPPPGFGQESQSVFATYSQMIYNGLIAKAARTEYWFEAVQQVKTWSAGSATSGQAGQATANQGEGQIGKPAQTKPAAGN